MAGLEVIPSTLGCGCIEGIEAPVEAEDEELARTRVPARRGGGGGGAFEIVVGGDRDSSRGSAVIASDIGVDRSDIGEGFCFSWLCLRENGGTGGLRFWVVGLDGKEVGTRLKSAAEELVSTAKTFVWGEETGNGGKGLSASLDVCGDLVMVSGPEKDNDGSSKDTVRGALVFTSLP